MQSERRVHVMMRKPQLPTVAVAVLLGSANTFAVETLTDEVLVAGCWILIVAGVRRATDCRVAGVLSAGAWMLIGTCLALAPDLRWRESSLFLSATGCTAGCILGLIYWALAELLWQGIHCGHKLVSRYRGKIRCERRLAATKLRGRLQFTVSRLPSILILGVLSLSWLGAVLNGTLRENHIIAQYEDVKPFVSRSFLLGKVTLAWFSRGRPKPCDSDLVRLSGLTSMSTLILSYPELTDGALQCLSGLPQVAALGIHSENVTDTGLVHLCCLANVRDLDLSDTKITDAGLQHLNGLTNLQELKLVRTNVTDAGVDHLNALRQLRWVDVSGTAVTDHGAMKLRQALPNCRVTGESQGRQASPTKH